MCSQGVIGYDSRYGRKYSCRGSISAEDPGSLMVLENFLNLHAGAKSTMTPVCSLQMMIIIFELDAKVWA